jgi:hypothetical protein
MRERIDFKVDEAIPPLASVLEAQGISDPADVPERIAALLDSAMRVFAELAEPRGLFAAVTQEAFAAVYQGEGLNDVETPLEKIFPGAGSLALFAATLGEPVSARISALLAGRDIALGYMLDAAASVSADRLADLLGERFLARLPRDGSKVLPYSPGYCGWHISGQGKLFEFLRAQELGIALNESYLMWPLKSVSGVLVAGMAQIHKFRPRYSFCEDCRTQSCVQRMRSVLCDRE